jgi:hypothetical protein
VSDRPQDTSTAPAADSGKTRLSHLRTFERSAGVDQAFRLSRMLPPVQPRCRGAGRRSPTTKITTSICGATKDLMRQLADGAQALG